MTEAGKTLKRLCAVLSASGDVAYDWDLVADEIHWLNGARQAFGLLSTSDIGTGEGFHRVIHARDLSNRLDALSAVYRGDESYECEYRLRHGNGEHRWYHDRGRAEFTPEGAPVRLLGTLRPITERKQSVERIAYLTNHDELTGHYNRTRLREALEHALYHSLRYGTSSAYLVIDADKINVVNQAFGYEIADSILLAIGRKLDGCLRASDTIGRIAGDRFGAVLSNCPASDIGYAAEKILSRAQDTVVETPVGPIHLTVSIGAVVFPDSAHNTTDVMTKADIALRQAKRAGRNTWAMYDYTEEQRCAHRRNIVIAEQVQQALRENRLSLSLQPLVDAGDREPALYECLLRIRQIDGSIMAARDFMPVVEELGLIRLVDRKVLEMVVAELTAYPEAKLAMNVSAKTTIDRSWLRAAVAALRGKPEIAGRLVVEITETAGLEDLEECARFVFALRDLGCRVALDDFGAGFTSFRHLRSLSVDMVKIDGSFVRNIGQNPDNLIFVRTLVELAHNFGLETVAECVETAEEAELLTNEGVNLLQGYAFGAPAMERPWAKVPAKAKSVGLRLLPTPAASGAR